MALMELELCSHALGMKAKCMVILPQQEQGIGMDSAAKTRKYPVLWLLHGASDDYTIWLRRTNVERYVAPLGLAVVMPAVHLSRYTNMAHGPRYFDYLAHELPEVLGGTFPLSDRREDHFVAGLSMGGYGAMKLGLSLPERYAAIGCFSSGNLVAGGVLPSLMKQRVSGWDTASTAIYGTKDLTLLLGDPTADLFAMAEVAQASGKPLPRIFHACGTEDFLLENARETARWFAGHPAFDYRYQEGAGSHSWVFWDEWIQAFLGWLAPDGCLK